MYLVPFTMITLKYEFIGLNVKIVDAKNKSLIGLEGSIVDETKNLLLIEDKGTVKKILKDQATFLITINEKKYEIDGRLLVGRPEERLKKIKK